MNGIRYMDNYVNYSFEAAVGIAYQALGKEWDKIDYIREYYRCYRFENVGNKYKSEKVPLYVSKKTGEVFTEKEQEEKWKDKEESDFVIGTMNFDLTVS